VDRVLEAKEVVVKPLSGILRRHVRFAGATILGDGAVVLIVNSSALDPNPMHALPPGVTNRAKTEAEVVEVMIVDDSLSIRRSVASLIRAAGWRVTQARDGVEALEVLQRGARPPDVILMDIEMPRMDGYELASRLRGQESYKHVPIIMLTSRAGEKHRRKAAKLGVNGYLVKPCPDDVLLTQVNSLLRPGTESRPRAKT